MICTQKILLVIVTVAITMVCAVVPITKEQCVDTVTPIVPIIKNEETVTEVVSDTPSFDVGVESVESKELNVSLDSEKGELVTFKVTAYCPCEHCSGDYGRMTSTGVLATAGRTIAVDPTYIPYGTKVTINGTTYIAEDCGGAIKGNRLDIFFDSHQEAVEFGVQQLKGVVDW